MVTVAVPMTRARGRFVPGCLTSPATKVTSSQPANAQDTAIRATPKATTSCPKSIPCALIRKSIGCVDSAQSPNRMNNPSAAILITEETLVMYLLRVTPR